MLERVLANWPLKLSSLAIAIAIWLSVTGETRIVQDFRIPLDVRLGTDQVLAVSPTNTLTVRLRGPETEIRDIDPLRLGLLLDLRDSQTGERWVQLSHQDISGIPAGVEVAWIEPSRVELTLEPRLRQEVPVVADLVGQPPQGYALYQSRARPPRVLVEGPASEVGVIERVRTNPIRLGERTASFVESVSAFPERPHVHIVDPRPVEVEVVIDTTPIERHFPRVPVQVSGSRVARPERVDVVIAGPAAFVDSLDPAQIRAIADVSALAPGGSGKVPLRVEVLDLSTQAQSTVSVRSVSSREVSVGRREGAG